MTSRLNHDGATVPSVVRGVARIALLQRCDHRGPLAVLGQDDAPLPFAPARVFITYDGNDASRGAHAHIACEQVLICVSGKVSVLVRDGENVETIELSSPKDAVHIGPMVWAEEFDHSPGAVLVVLASHPYDEADYIRNMDAWLAAVKGAAV